MMVDQGYDGDFSTAVTITSSCEGLLVPPSHNMVIYATTAGGISVGSLFLAGYIPGALLAASLMIGSYIISVKRNYPKGDKFSMKVLLKQFSVSFWALAAVLIVVVGVVGGVFTATESAAIAVIYSLLVSVFIYKGLDWKGVWRVLGDCIDTLSIVLILIATSSIFGYCLTQLHVPDLAATAIIELYQQPNRTGTAVKPDPSGFRLYHGYGSDHPDRNSYPSADRNLYRYRSHSVRYHGSIKLRYRPSDSSGWFRSFHRFRHCKAANGEGCKSYPSILPVHDHYAASDHICTGNQPVAASGIGITAEIIYN